MKIAAFEGFYGGSHKQWLDGLARHSSHEYQKFTLSDRFWKWRMHGGAVTLASRFNESGFEPDLILATDMLDLSVLLTLTRHRTSGLPVVLYMHENQLNYPWSDQDRDVTHGRDHHYAFINYTSALAADRVIFNSEYHREAFLGELPRFLRMYPDHQNQITVSQLEAKAMVLPIGLDLAQFDRVEPQPLAEEPVILWNHRWEYDKQPEVFFDAMLQLSKEGYLFKLIVCGEQTDVYPEVFDAMRAKLEGHILHWGFAEGKGAYVRLLRGSDIMPVTSRQDFFGISAVEAMYCGVYPLLPDRLAFPEHVPEGASRQRYFMHTDNELLV